MLNMWVSLNTENYKNRRRKTKKMCRAKKIKALTLKCFNIWRKQVKEMKQENSI